MEYRIRKLTDDDAQLAEKLKLDVYKLIGCCQTVHRELGPFLNEYIYQDALDIALDEAGLTPKQREYAFQVHFHGKPLPHTHRVDFFVQNQVIVECKAVATLGPEHRQQLWNYMRLTGAPIGVLYNFAPLKDQCERYYYDKETGTIFLF